MPWNPADALRHTKKATTAKLQQEWAEIANSALHRGATDALAVREANGVVRDRVAAHKHKTSKKAG